MRLFEAIIEANNRYAGGDKTAVVREAEFADTLPVVALTCIDVRLNPLMPVALGLAPEHFIWLRNAGNIITSTTSSTMRSLALACAIKGGREIAIIGHSDCRAGQTTMMDLIERFRVLGVERAKLPENLTEFFGVFASERQNVLKAVDFVRASPLIGARIPVHGFLVDIQSGRLEWLVNGYQTLAAATAQFAAAIHVPNPTLQSAFASEESPAVETKHDAPPPPDETHAETKPTATKHENEPPPKHKAEQPAPPHIPVPPPLFGRPPARPTRRLR